MTVYLGDKAVGVNSIVEKEVPEERFGVKVGDIIGTVDADGTYRAPTGTCVLDFVGAKNIPYYGCAFLFTRNNTISSFFANDIVSVDASAFRSTFQNAHIKNAHIDNLEIVNKNDSFYYYCYGASYLEKASFAKLREIAASAAFYNAFRYAGTFSGNNSVFDVDEVFPSLETVSASQALDNVFEVQAGQAYIYSKIKKITGGSATYTATFGVYYACDTKWYFPSATEFTGYILSCIYDGELHFAAANQVALEACEGYDYKWGFTGATIYFDLITTITIDGVAYSRGLTIGGYTAWTDENGNAIYTNADAEPTVGTVVYSDQGTTQVGTVSEAA